MTTNFEMKKIKLSFYVLIGLIFLTVSAQAKLYILAGGKGADYCPTTDYFTMEVSDLGSQVLFTFTNNIDAKGTLTRLFFMKNDLMTFNSIDDDLTSEGVSFSYNDKNAMPPGGHSLGFTPHNTFSIDANPPKPKNGLHYEEYVSALFDLTSGISYGDIIASIDDFSLPIAARAQGIPGRGGTTFSPIPEPATLALIGFGALLIHYKKRGTAQRFQAIRSA